ncbi:methyltransferase [Mesorhizobium sp. BR1-1-16]|uniref:methyltransferase n=1 Tax=Mesorhizobium sp. BR1-1-16 TaxID=2876653 RepID=UPI00256FB555|nr:methyltransferase [Mesorhizobium sp. BR1-1-16]
MVGGFAATQLLVTAARLSIADHMTAGHRDVESLATAIGAAPDSLRRFMRMLVVLGLLRQIGSARFSLTAMGEFLRADHPRSMRPRLLYIGEVNYPTAQASVHAVMTGEKAFDKVFGLPLFEFLDSRPDLSATFSGLMSESVHARAEGICKAYDFAGASLIVDVGGGEGTLLKAVLRAAPGAEGVVFDRPTVADAQDRQSTDDANPALRFVSGDMFERIEPAQADIYMLSNIIHDWDDAESELILSKCRAAMRPDSRLLIIEELLPSRIEDAPATIANDYSMLLLTGGHQRTRREFARLLKAAGLRLTTVVPVARANHGVQRRENWMIMECLPTR